MTGQSLVSQSQYAQQRGVDSSAAPFWKRGGHLVMSDSLVDVAASNATLAQRPTGYRGGRGRTNGAGAAKMAEKTLQQLLSLLT